MVAPTSAGEKKYGPSFGEPLRRAKGVTLTERECRGIKLAVALKISPDKNAAPTSDAKMLRAFLCLPTTRDRESFLLIVETEAKRRFV
jgi:hypothetical protein